MHIVDDSNELKYYLKQAANVSRDNPVVVLQMQKKLKWMLLQIKVVY